MNLLSKHEIEWARYLSHTKRKRGRFDRWMLNLDTLTERVFAVVGILTLIWFMYKA